MTGVLSGLLVADLSRVLAGPLATMTLADLGATVVKVERPDLGDDTRSWMPPSTPTGASSYFESVNRSKYSLTLDLEDPQDRAAAVMLTRRADVVVENYRPGVLARFGLDYASVRSRNRRAIYCSITGFGELAGAELPGYDFVVQAVGGLMSITGDSGGDPYKVGVALVDVLTGKDAVIGILAAVHARTTTGVGEHVRVDLLSSLLGGLANQAAAYLATGVAPQRAGNQHPSIAPYETLQCADALLAVACGNDGQFRKLADAIGRPELADDARFSTNPARVSHRAALREALEGTLASAAADVWERRLADAGVPAGQIGDIGSAIARADALGLQPLVDVGPRNPRQIRHPIRYESATVSSPSPPPALGRDNVRIREWLAGPPAALVHPSDHGPECNQ